MSLVFSKKKRIVGVQNTRPNKLPAEKVERGSDQ